MGMMTPLKMYEEKIKNIEVNEKLKRSLLEGTKTCTTPMQYSMFLLDAIEQLDNILNETSERLIYAEQNRTHPKDILVVGDGNIEFSDLDLEIGDDKFTAGFNFKF